MEKDIILDTDDVAARKITVTGWVSKSGRFYGENESLTRYEGSTHKKCDCGNVIIKRYSRCDFCNSKKEIEKYNSYPFKEWDKLEPVYSETYKKYFFSPDEIEEHIVDLEDNEEEVSDLRLLICRPNKAHSVNSSIWEDILTEDGEIPSELQDKLDELNQFIETMSPLSWSPSNVRTAYNAKG